MSADGQEPVTLPEVVALARRYPTEARNGQDYPPSDWAVVNDDDEVIGCFRAQREALACFYERLEGDPLVGLELRVIEIRSGGEVNVRWPSRQTPYERAEDAATRVVWKRILPEEISTHIHPHFLNARLGQARFGKTVERIVELSWFDPDGEPELVGYLWPREHGEPWELIAPKQRCLNPEIAASRIAEALNDAIPLQYEPLDAQQVRVASWELHHGGRVALREELLKTCVQIAERLGVLARDGSDLA